jgi:hypothetical protein
LQYIPIVKKLMFRNKGFLIWFRLSFGFSINTVIWRFQLISSCYPCLVLQLFCKHLIKRFSVFSLSFLILLHKVEDVDRVHGEINKIILLSLEAILNLFVQCVSLILTTNKYIINKLISHCSICSFEDEIGTIL